MAREKESTPPVSRVNVRFKDFKVHSDSLSDYFVDSEPSNRVQAESDEKENRADIEFKKLVNGATFPNYKNAGLKPQVNRRNK